MAVELATAYVSLVASARGIASSIASELADPLEKAAKVAGAKVTDTLRRAVEGMSLTAVIKVPGVVVPDIPAPLVGRPTIPEPAGVVLAAIPAPVIARPEIPEPSPLVLEPIPAPKIGMPEIERPSIPEPSPLELDAISAPGIGRPEIPEPTALTLEGIPAPTIARPVIPDPTPVSLAAIPAPTIARPAIPQPGPLDLGAIEAPTIGRPEIPSPAPIALASIGAPAISRPEIPEPAPLALAGVPAPAIGRPEIPEPDSLVLAGIPAPAIARPAIPDPAPPDLASIAAPEIGMPEIPEPRRLTLENVDAPEITQPEIPEPDRLKLADIAAPKIGQPKVPKLDAIPAPKIGKPEIPAPAPLALRTVAAPKIGRPEIPEPITLVLSLVPAPEIARPEIPEPAPINLDTIAAPVVGMPEIPEPARISIPTLDAPKIERPEIPKADDDRFLSGAKAAGVAAGAAAAAGLGVGFLSATGAEVSNDKLAAQLGIQNPDFAGDLGRIAGQVYVGNFGDSLGQVNEAIRGVLQSGLLPEDATNAQIQSITEKTLGLVSVFDQDLPMAAASAGQLVRTGLANNADEALDVLVRGFQQGVDKSGDLLDTLNEYPTQFRQLGLSAADATGILSQGLKAGARDSDVVGDALKEFVLLAQAGTDETKAAFDAIGISAADIAAKLAAGGPAAKEGLDQVFDRFRALPPTADKAAIAMGLFGSKSEDLQAALNGIDPSSAAGALGEISGAADQMNAIVGDNTASAFESFKRTLETKLAGVATAFGPVLDVAPALGGLALTGQALAGPLQALAGPLKAVRSGILSVGKAAVTGTAKVVGQTAAFVAQKAAAIAGAVATKAMAAAQWLLNVALTANPIGLIVVAIAALVAGLVLAYKHSETFRKIVQAAFGAVLDAAKAVGRVVVGAMDVVTDAFKSVVDWLKGNWDVVLTILTGPFGAAVLIVRRFGDDIVGFFSGLPGRLATAAGDVFGWLRDKATAAKDWVLGRIGDVVGAVVALPGRLVGVGANVFGWLKDQATSAKDWVGARLTDTVAFFTGLPGRFSKTAGDVFGFLWTSFKAAINSIIRGWNNLEFKLPSFEGLKIAGRTVIPGFEGPTLGTPNIPLLHDGGIVPGPRGADVLAILQAGEEVRSVAQVAEGGGRRAGFSVGDINVTTEREERTARDVRFELQSLAHLLGA